MLTLKFGLGVPRSRRAFPDKPGSSLPFLVPFPHYLFYEELAEHYGTAIVPARVRRPDDKAAAEGSVRFVSTWITAALRDQKFFSLDEANQAMREKLAELNIRPFRKRTCSRLSAFEQEEKEFLQPLPIIAYEPASWLNPKVGLDYLVSDGKNKYSVPYDLIGETVDVRLTRHIVEVFYRQTRVAVHVRLDKAKREPVVKTEHMPENHRKYLHYNAEDFTEWANTIGSATAKAVHYFLTRGKEPEQGYKACASLTKLVERHGAEVNAQDTFGETALMIAVSHNHNADTIKALLDAGADVDMKDNNGKSAANYVDDLRLCRRVKDIEILKRLKAPL